MSQLFKGILTASAVALTLGAAQFASGRDLSGGQQDQASAAEPAINRAAKADRAARAAGPASPTQTISLRLDGLSDTSVLVRIPVAQAARNGAARSITTSPDRKLTVACEPVVSVLTEAARQLPPGRCVT